MVCLFHVSLSFPARRSGSSFPVQLFGSGFHHLPAVTEALEGETAGQFTGLSRLCLAFDASGDSSTL